MSEQFHDDDIEFDFFEEVDTREQEPLERPREQGPGGPPPRPPRSSDGSGLTPRARLIGLIAVAVLVVLGLVFLIVSCTGEGKASTYKTYMEKMSSVAGGMNLPPGMNLGL